MFKMAFLCCGKKKEKKQQWKKTGSASVSGYSAMNIYVKTVSFSFLRRSFTPWSHRLAAVCVMWFYGLRSLYLQLWLSGLLFMSCKFSQCRFEKKKPMTQHFLLDTGCLKCPAVFYLPRSKTRHLVVVSVGRWEVYRFPEFHFCIIFPSPKIAVMSTLLNGC